MRTPTLVWVVVAAASVAAGALASPAAAAAGEPEAVAAVATAAPADAVIATYFHGNKRCSTCRKLEAYSDEAITEGFPKEIVSGDLQWRVVNVDEPANAHYVTDFELVTKALVLVEVRDGEVVRWRNLKLIWQLVRDKDGFLTYVRRETREFLEGR